MCGICGIISFDGQRVDPVILKNMNNTMLLRGPDDGDVYIDGSFGMAMRRLSIIDIAHGHQPLSNEDESVWIVLNGEIYNYVELRSDLIKRGHTFKTQSDTEVLVHLYEDFGTDAIKYLNGMFAFCLWDKKKKRAWIGRDRLGIKPLVYWQSSQGIAFGSTNETITSLPHFEPQIDRESLLLYFGLAYVPSPRSIWKNIKKLQPGHCLLIENNQIKEYQYWSVDELVPTHVMEPATLDQKIADLLWDSIKLHSRSDVPVGCFLSGGIDSSVTTAMFCQISDRPVHTFSVNFQNNEISDLTYAKMVADQYHTLHHPYELSAAESCDILDQLVPLLDEPVSDSAIVPSYFLSMKAKEYGIKVLLSGAGGDELFGGYARHYKSRRDSIINILSLLPRFLWKRQANLPPHVSNHLFRFNSKSVNYGISTSAMNLGWWSRLFNDSKDYYDMIELIEDQFNCLKKFESSNTYSHVRMKTDVKQYLVDDVLSLFDKTSMAASLEGRVPLLDHRLAELSFTSHERNLLSKATSKILLKKFARGLVPDEIINRSKTGFNGPVLSWINSKLGESLISQMRETSFQLSDMINHSVIQQLISNSHLTAAACENLFSMYVYMRWYKHPVNNEMMAVTA